MTPTSRIKRSQSGNFDEVMLVSLTRRPVETPRDQLPSWCLSVVIWLVVFLNPRRERLARHRPVRYRFLTIRLPGRLLRFRYRRRAPFSRECFGLGTIKAHGQVKCPLRRRKPVGFLVLAWALVLEIEVERTVRVGLER